MEASWLPHFQLFTEHFFVIKQKNSNYHHYALTIFPNSPEDLNADFMAGFHKTVGIPGEKHTLSCGVNLLKYG